MEYKGLISCACPCTPSYLSSLADRFADDFRLRSSARMLRGGKGRSMAETPARYCGNCGNELEPEDRFCQNCGKPVHQAARVPTPEADVPLPPPPQTIQGVSDPANTQKSWLWKWWPFAAVVFVFILLAASVGGNSGGSGSGSVGGNGGGGGGKLAEKPKQEQSATELADLFANGQFYTFLQKENKDGDQLILGVLAGSESDSQIDKIAREIDYDKSRYDVVTVGVLTKDD